MRRMWTGAENALRRNRTNFRVLAGSCLVVAVASLGIFGCRPGALQEQTPQNAGKVVLRWRTDDLENTFGFNVYRATSRKGTFTKVNEFPILAKSTELGQYEYVDKPVPMKQIYFYYIEAISQSGDKHKLTLTIPGVVLPLDQ